MTTKKQKLQDLPMVDPDELHRKQLAADLLRSIGQDSPIEALAGIAEQVLKAASVIYPEPKKQE